MARMESQKASQVKINGELAKKKLATKLNCVSSREIFLSKESHPEIYNFINTEGKLMLRVGKNWQFHLGDLPELGSISFFAKSIKKVKVKNKTLECGTYDKAWDTQIKQLKSSSFWEKYFCKGNNVFCFSNDNYEYFFFNIHDMVQYIITNTKWRLLETGRIKGDLFLEDGTSITIFTIEFRNESHKKCFAFGAHGGGKGIQLFLILLRNIKHYHCQL
ncbi:MAG: hypothetical protein ACK4V4_00070 [Sphingobacteriales bacterium]|jgi:hypothetical protein